MKIFLTGATGYIGRAVASALQAGGKAVSGLARTPEAERKLHARGITPAPGDLYHPQSLIQGVSSADAVIHTATTNDGRADFDAISAMLGAMEGSGKPFIFTSGVWVLGNTGDTPATEDAPLQPAALVAWRADVESHVLAASRKNIRSIVIRPAVVYGEGAGIPSMFIQSANETGAARYIGRGDNRWSAVHVKDLAGLYALALEKAPADSIYHGVDGSASRVREIAEAASFGADAGGRTASWPVEEAKTKLGAAYVDALLLDQVVSGEKARRELGWHPLAATLLEDLRYGSYAAARINP